MSESPDKPAGSLLAHLWSRLGPGLVTGAADDDPSGIATHSQIGAQFGFGLAWTFVLSFPLMVVIQEVAAEIGSVTGRGIAHNLRRHYSPWLLRSVVTLLLVANIVNLGADLGAMGAALQLLIGGPEQLYTLLFGVVCIVLEVWLNYPRYAAVLKWGTLSLFSYVAVVFVADVPWATALKSLFIPTIDLTGASAMAMVAILGTTISPYLFFWQAGQEVEEQHRHHAKPLCVSPKTAGPELARIRIDTITGMAFSSLVSLATVCHRGDAEQPRRYRYRHVGAGRRGAASDRRRVRVCAVRLGNHRHRPAGGAGAGGFGGLCGQRSVRLG